MRPLSSSSCAIAAPRLSHPAMRAIGFRRLRPIDTGLPTQSYRSGRQVDLEQCSTPLSLAWRAGRAAAIGADDIVLGSFAGTGMPGVHALRAGQAIQRNERDPTWATLLSRLLGTAVTHHDAEHIGALMTNAPADHHPDRSPVQLQREAGTGSACRNPPSPRRTATSRARKVAARRSCRLARRQRHGCSFVSISFQMSALRVLVGKLMDLTRRIDSESACSSISMACHSR
jgi:hypothetical protein